MRGHGGIGAQMAVAVFGMAVESPGTVPWLSAPY